MRETIASLLAGELDEQLVYRKRLRRPLDEYQRNVPPHVRAARLADDYNRSQGRPLQYQNGGWISYVMTVAGPEPLEARSTPLDYDHYVCTSASAGRRRNFALHRRRFCYTGYRATGAILRLRLVKKYFFFSGDEMAAIQYHSALS